MIKGYTGEDFELNVECEISAIAVERGSQGAGEVASKVAIDNTYNLSGTLVDSDDNTVSGGTLVLLSTPHIVEVGTDGTFEIDDLEAGRHHMYYFKDLTVDEVTALNLEDKTENEINKLTTITSNSTFTTTDTKVKLSDGYKINKYEKEIILKGINLYKMMKISASNEEINFNINSGTSGTNGIYTTTETETGEPVYYYRGSYSKVNNNLIFNNMCWKIIRTTETGGVKLIYNGIPTDGRCTVQTGDTTQIGYAAFNLVYGGNTYMGYMYGTADASTYEETHANINDSRIKAYIDNWYTTNFDATATAKLEDTIFCNDRSTVSGGNNNTLASWYGTLGYGSTTTSYGVNSRASYNTVNLSPSLKCANANDKFTVSSENGNGALTYPVGLITLDEAVLAGFNSYSSNSKNYIDSQNFLYSNITYWTLSPVSHYYNPCLGIIGNSGSIGSQTDNFEDGVRPVVSLASGVLAELGGDGSTTNPYVVQ